MFLKVRLFQWIEFSVNIEEGFLIHWCDSFMSHFGKDSLFVRALSDFHTLKIAKMMYDTGQLHNFETVKLYVDEPSVEAIWFLARQCELVGKPLFQAPLGSTRSGAIEAAVDLS